MNDSRAMHPSNATTPIRPREHRVGCLMCNTPTWNADAICDWHQDDKVAASHTRSVAR